MATTSFAQNGLVRVAYEIRGEGDQVVVLLHGVLSDRVALRPLADALEETSRVLSIDMRGHGASSAVHGVSLQLEDLAADVLAVLDAAEVDSPVTIVGVELGALIGQRLRADVPERVGELVAVNLPDELVADKENLRAIADRAYKGLIEQAVDQWLTLAWGDEWRTTVPKPRIASARRSAPALHAVLMALTESDIEQTASIRVPGGIPFADDADVDVILQRLEQGRDHGLEAQ